MLHPDKPSQALPTSSTTGSATSSTGSLMGSSTSSPLAASAHPHTDHHLKDERSRFPVLQINYDNRKTVKRPSWDCYFLDIAESVSKRSHDGETQVGVVIVDENKRILATGYNGFPPGCDDSVLPNLRPDKYPFMVHAETNAIAASRQDLRNSTLYVTWSPCRDCAKAIITSGVRTVVYRQEYKNEDYDFVMNFLRSCGLDVRHVPS